jgi:hypothetical protein
MRFGHRKKIAERLTVGVTDDVASVVSLIEGSRRGRGHNVNNSTRR